jgi:hypothetical protein
MKIFEADSRRIGQRAAGENVGMEHRKKREHETAIEESGSIIAVFAWRAKQRRKFCLSVEPSALPQPGGEDPQRTTGGLVNHK